MVDDLSDCKVMLSTGQYEILTCEATGEKYIFPKTVPEEFKHSSEIQAREVSSIEDWLDVSIPALLKLGFHSWSCHNQYVNQKRVTRKTKNCRKSN